MFKATVQQKYQHLSIFGFPYVGPYFGVLFSLCGLPYFHTVGLIYAVWVYRGSAIAQCVLALRQGRMPVPNKNGSLSLLSHASTPRQPVKGT